MFDALIIDCLTNEGPLLLLTLRIICSSVWEMVCVVDAILGPKMHHFVSLLCKDESCIFFVLHNKSVVTPKRAVLNGVF